MYNQIRIKAITKIQALITLYSSLPKGYKKLIYASIGIWAFFHFALFANSGYSLRDPLEFLGNYFIIVVIPAVSTAAVVIAITFQKNPSLLPLRMRKYAKLHKQQETLKKRVEQESWPRFMQNMETRILLFVLLPLSIKLQDLFPNSLKIWKWTIPVTRRYLTLAASHAVIYPRNSTGYFLQIDEYYWTDTHIIFKIRPTLGVQKTLETAVRRLDKSYQVPPSKIQHYVEDNFLYISVPHKWILPKFAGKEVA